MSNQLVKRNPVEGYKNVFPKTFIDAIKDRESGASLEEILQGFNMYFLSYNGSKTLTRCRVPRSLRKEGLWITYVLYDHTVVTEWYNSDNIDDESWGNDSNWRIASNALVGDISISTDGYWIINGATTNIKAQGETGITPLLRMGDNNKIQVTYNEGKNWEDISDYIVPKFRWNQGIGTTAGTIQISMDLGNTWKDLSNPITNNLRISKYIGINESLPTSGVAEGTVYMKGPYYDENDSLNENPIYRMWVYAWKGNTLAWQDNGEFTSISAGVVQERGTSTTQVMSQDAVTRELTELESNSGALNKLNVIITESKTEDSYVLYPNGEIIITEKGLAGTTATEPIDIEGISALFLPMLIIRSTDSKTGYAFYDSGMNYISGIAPIQGEDKVTGWKWVRVAVPQNAKYIRCSVWNESIINKYNLDRFAIFGDTSASAQEIAALKNSLRFKGELDLSLFTPSRIFPTEGGNWSNLYYGYIVPCSGGDRFTITSQEASIAQICFIRELPLSDGIVKYAAGYKGNGLTIDKNTTKEVVAPADANFLYILKESVADRTPAKVETDAILVSAMWNIMESALSSANHSIGLLGAQTKWEDGRCVIADMSDPIYGQIVESSRFALSDYMNVAGDSTITYNQIKVTYSAPTSAGIIFYDSNYKEVDGIPAILGADTNGYKESTAIVPINAVYVRFTKWANTEEYGEFKTSLFAGLVNSVEELEKISKSNSQSIRNDVDIINVNKPQILDKHIFATISTYMAGYENKEEEIKITEWTDGSCVLAQGNQYAEVVSSSRFSLSAFVPIGNNNMISFSNIVTSYTDAGAVFYDSSKNPISGIPAIYSESKNGYEQKTYDVPNNAAYIRFTKWADDATYGEFSAGFSNQYLIFSRDLGRTWNYVPNIYGTIQLCHIFSDGSIIFASKSKVYRTEDYQTVSEVSVYGINGENFVSDGDNFFEYKSGDSWVFDNDGNEMFVFGEYRLDGGPTHIWYTTDRGKSFKCAHKFGTSILGGQKLWIRHVHQIIYDKYRGCWYVITGDEGTECNILKGLYNYADDSWSFKVLAQGQAFKFGEVRILRDEIILTTDYTYEYQIADRGLLVCNKDKLNDPSAYRYVVNFPAEWLTGNVGLTHLFVDKNGNQLVLPDYVGYGMFFLAQKGQEFKKCTMNDNTFLMAGNISGPNFNGDVYLSTRTSSESPVSSLMGRWINITQYLRGLGVTDFMKESIYL